MAGRKPKGLVVSGAAVVLKLKDGGERYLYKGAPVSRDVFDADAIKRAVGFKLIAEVEVADDESGDDSGAGAAGTQQ